MMDVALIETMLMNYAAGTLNPFEAMIMAAHAAMNPRARRKVSHYETLGGAMVENETPAPVTDSCLQSVLKAIDDIENTATDKPCGDVPAVACTRGRDLGIPPAVYAVLMQACNSQQWRWKGYGGDIDFIDIDLCPDKINRCRDRKIPGQMRLLRVKPMGATPRHRHTHGIEMTLVVEGSYEDETGVYRRGDLSILGPDHSFSHSPRAGAEGCICLTLTREPEPLILRLLGRFL